MRRSRTYTAEQKERGYYGNPRADMMKFVPASTRMLLDVGCGRGAFGASVKRIVGAQVWGIELNHEAARVATIRLDRVIEGDLHEAFASLPIHHFDCVAFNDILEHLVNPDRALNAAKRLVRPGGVVVASLPNLRYFPVLWDVVWRGKWEYADSGVLDRTHLRFFTKRDMKALFEYCGYTVEQLVGITPHFKRGERLLASFLPKRFADVQYMQFAIVAKPRT